MSMRSPLAHVRGLGAAKQGGTLHWWQQRLSSMALVPLTVWFVISAIGLVGVDHAAYAYWLGNPGNTLLMALFVIAVFIHAGQGLQVVVEDYIHGEAAKVAALLAVKVFVYLVGGAALLAVLKVAFGG